jgi:hypothetical protein
MILMSFIQEYKTCRLMGLLHKSGHKAPNPLTINFLRFKINMYILQYFRMTFESLALYVEINLCNVQADM